MNASEHRHHHRAFLVAAASALGLTLAACGDKQPSNDLTQIPQAPERTSKAQDATDRMGGKMDQAAADAGRTLDAAGNAIQEKASEAGKAIEDATITARVKSALVAEPGLKSASINVDTTAGIVTLRGVAGSHALRQKAERVAAAIDGVRSVKNELVVVQA